MISEDDNRVCLKVSVIICCYSIERLNDTQEAVNSILAQKYNLHELIIAVDHTLEVFQRLKIILPPPLKVVLNQKNRGLSETRNTGVRVATGEIIAFIDDDAVAAPDWLENLCRHYRNSQVIAVGGKALPLWEGGRRPNWFPEELDWIVGCTHKTPETKSSEVRNIIGCNMSFRREAFNNAGLFNSRVGRVGIIKGLGEDTEICLRIKQVLPDKLILYEPEAIIYHKVAKSRLSLMYLIKRSYNEGLFKNTIRHLFPGVSSASATENTYLRYLLGKAVIANLKLWENKYHLSQGLAIILSVAGVGAGYLKGKIRLTFN